MEENTKAIREEMRKPDELLKEILKTKDEEKALEMVLEALLFICIHTDYEYEGIEIIYYFNKLHRMK